MSRKQKRMTLRIVVSAALTILIHFLPIDNSLIKLALFVLPYLLVGYDVLIGATSNIFSGRLFDERFLMALATVGAFIIGEYTEAVAVIIFYQVGELFQSIAVGKSRRSIASLMDIRPDTAVVLREGEELELSPEEVEVGEVIIVRAGEKIALDGEIIEGSSTLDTSVLTGESVPREVAPGEAVISGSVNLGGLLRIRVSKLYGESTVAKVLELIENSAEKKAKVENFITRFSHWYTPAVVGAATLLALGLSLFSDAGVWESIRRALTFLVVSCPCALVVSVPLSFFGGIGGASKEGVLIKGANYLEMLSRVDTIIFDKTGTLTEGRFELESVSAAEGIEREYLLERAALAEFYSNHPIAESIKSAVGEKLDPSRVRNVREIAGMGLEAEIDGEDFLVGNASLMSREGISVPCDEGGASVVYVARKSGEYLGCISVRDLPKVNSAAAIRGLHGLGIEKTVMLSGDKESVAERIGHELGIDEIHASLLPHEKVEKLETLLDDKKSGRVAFVGDGINDAPSLSRADVGVSMGALGSDAAIEAADIVLMDDDPLKLVTAIKISKKTMRIVKENIYFALIAKFAILVLGALGMASMWLAVFGDVGILILAILNSTRAMRWRR